MELALTEIHYFPAIPYLRKLAQHPVVVIDQHEHYQKGSYRNRMHIAGANGLQRLSIPLKKGKNQQLSIREVEISYEENWQHQHWQSIRSAYGKAPFFEHYAPEIEPLYQQAEAHLFDWNLKCLEILVELIDLEVTFRQSDRYYKVVPEGWVDYRNQVHPKPHRQASGLLPPPAVYPQLFEEKNGFLPNLSILDLIFCLGPQSLLYIVGQ